MTSKEPLTFAMLDDLAFAAERGRLDRVAGLAVAAADLGPLLELVQLAASGLLPGPDPAPWLALNGAASFQAALTGGRPQWVCPGTRQIGFFRLAATVPADDTPWVQFALAAHKAATDAGFTGKTAAQLAGALGELHSNVYEHSGRPETGFAAFRAREGVFEFAVADSGIGVLASLNTCPDHAALTDHGDALRLALTEGVSRHPRHGVSPAVHWAGEPVRRPAVPVGQPCPDNRRPHAVPDVGENGRKAGAARVLHIGGLPGETGRVGSDVHTFRMLAFPL